MALYSGDVRSSIYLQIIKQTLGFSAVSEEASGSLPGIPPTQISTCGKQVHLIGAVGETALPGVRFLRVSPSDSGVLGFACAGLWRDLALNKASSSKYHQVYQENRCRGDFYICRAFSPVWL